MSSFSTSEGASYNRIFQQMQTLAIMLSFSTNEGVNFYAKFHNK